MAPSRAAAIAALALGALAAGLAIAFAGEQFPGGLLIAALIALAGTALWYAAVRRGPTRFMALAAAVLGSAAALVLIFSDGKFHWLLVAAVLVLSSLCTRAAFRTRFKLPAAPAPSRPVLFLNPKSGGGKAERFHLADEAKARGIEPVVLERGDDLVKLVRDAVDRGANGLAMAGGDGSQAIVASIAAELDLPYACIPSGTRNHFALDLGVDRDDVVGALEAFVDGGERRVDLAEVNGQVFVNNVSLGVYAEAVQREGYRESKLRTILGTFSDWQAGEGEGPEMSWHGPGGRQHHAGVVILVSNNRYRLGHAVGSGTRPHIDDGLLGVTVVGAPSGGEGEGGERRLQRPWREWSAPEFEVEADAPVPAGIDGEAMKLEPPLRFEIRPGVLRVRIAPGHPGASPSALMPEHAHEAILDLFRIAAGRGVQRSPRARSQV